MLIRAARLFDTIYPLERTGKGRPEGEYPRRKVATYLSARVEKVDRSLVPWCVYIAERCPFIIWENGVADFPDDWLDVEEFALDWEDAVEEVVVVEEKEEEYVEDLPYSGWLTVLPEGPEVAQIGDYVYYESREEHPFSLAFAQRYMSDLEKHSFMIHPMQLDDSAGVLDQGWMFKKKRLEVARELLAALKWNNSLPLYIPGDGVGFFSLVCREMGIKYFSTEPARCGIVAIKMGLVTVPDVYNSCHGEGHVLVASQLVPFVPDVINHKGPRVIFDQQRWYATHPKDLKIIAATGHRVCYTGDLLKNYQPLLLLDKGFTATEMTYIVSKVEDAGGNIVSEDKSMISKCLLSGLAVASRSYGGYGPLGWIKEVNEKKEYLHLGRGPGCVDPLTQTDVNLIRHARHGESVPVYYGREGVKVFSPYHDNYAQPFGRLMTWVSPTQFYELQGMYRQKVRFRARKWQLPGLGEVLAIRTRGLTEPVVAVQYGHRMYSAEVDETQRREVSGWMITPVKLGVAVANVQDIRKARTVPAHVVATMMQNDRWYSQVEYDKMSLGEIVSLVIDDASLLMK